LALDARVAVRLEGVLEPSSPGARSRESELLSTLLSRGRLALLERLIVRGPLQTTIRPKLVALFAILAGSVGCSGGEDLCKRLAAAVQVCGLRYVGGQGDGGFSDGILRVAEITEASCNAGISSCTPDEQTSLRRYSDCSLSGSQCSACTYQGSGGPFVMPPCGPAIVATPDGG